MYSKSKSGSHSHATSPNERHVEQSYITWREGTQPGLLSLAQEPGERTSERNCKPGSLEAQTSSLPRAPRSVTKRLHSIKLQDVHLGHHLAGGPSLLTDDQLADSHLTSNKYCSCALALCGKEAPED